MTPRTILPFLLLLLTAGCAGARVAPPQVRAAAPAEAAAIAANPQAPPFATVGYAPFLRTDAVAIALREWRLFGQPVDDDPPDTRPVPLPDDKPERMPGLWQRVGEYWWEALDPGSVESGWTGKHNSFGQEFPAGDDRHYAWSAAFISYVMRIAGARNRFPYSASHSDYINAAVTGGYALTAERPEAYAPVTGDLICFGRGRNAMKLHFDDLPAGHFPGHCAIVVATNTPGQIAVIGGNVDDAVTLTHIPVTADGKLATPDGLILDTRYPWFVVLRVNYDPPAAPVAPTS